MVENDDLENIITNKINILQWTNLTITSKKDNRKILNNLNGEIKSGQSLAIMGSSGAGKTTFLNYISKKSGTNLSGLSKTSGCINFLANNFIENKLYSLLSGYVPQDDILWEDLTPREHFIFAAKLKLNNLSETERNEIVEKMIVKLGLEKCSDTKVGNVLKKELSGGEKKRTSIGYELIANPLILFLDEPTTGLDSVSAYKVVKLITEEAKLNNRIIIFTIHQPSSEIFKLFDNLLLLSEGKCMYHGGAMEAINYFSQLGYPCPIDYNPTEYFIKILSKETKNVEVLDISSISKKRKSIKKFKDSGHFDLTENNQEIGKIQNSSLNEEYDKTINLFENNYLQTINITDFKLFNKNPNLISINQKPFFNQLLILFKRNLTISLRNKAAYSMRLFMTIFNSLIVLLVFSHLGSGNNAIQDRNGCLWFITTAVIQSNIQTSLMIFANEKPIFYKEQQNSMYGVVPYFLSKTILEIPLQIVLSIVVFVTTYFLAGLSRNTPENYFIFLITTFLAGYCGGTFGIFLGSLIDRKELIPTLFPALLYTQVQAAGYFNSVKTIPYIFYPFKYISVFRYCYQAFCWNEYRNLTPESLDCTLPVKCRLPTEDFNDTLEASLIYMTIIAVVNNILAVLSLKLNIFNRKRINK
jgi:ABC-type multidrug transport system ATPase subunit/ABC-type multidrug transport system permease subunit